MFTEEGKEVIRYFIICSYVVERYIGELEVREGVFISFEIGSGGAGGHRRGIDIIVEDGDEEVLVTAARRHRKPPCQIRANPCRPVHTFRGGRVMKGGRGRVGGGESSVGNGVKVASGGDITAGPVKVTKGSRRMEGRVGANKFGSEARERREKVGTNSTNEGRYRRRTKRTMEVCDEFSVTERADRKQSRVVERGESRMRGGRRKMNVPQIFRMSFRARKERNARGRRREERDGGVCEDGTTVWANEGGDTHKRMGGRGRWVDIRQERRTMGEVEISARVSNNTIPIGNGERCRWNGSGTKKVGDRGKNRRVEKDGRTS